MNRSTLALGVLALAVVVAACSGATAAPAPGADAVSIVASDMRFVETQVSVPAGAAFIVEFDNQDGAPHNVAISDASGVSIFKGEIVSATTIAYSVPALAAGAYTFICEIHPDMQGAMAAH
jgi:plastocyanin